MIHQLLWLAAALLLAGALGSYLHGLVKCHLIYVSFKKKSRGMPILPDRKLLGNHMISWFIRKNFCPDLKEAHEKLGKTVGMIFHHTYGVSTTDLNLIKLMIYDEPNKHMNRMKIGIPMEEFEKSIMLADENWRRLRNAFAPALKSQKFKHPNVVKEVEQSIVKLVNMIDSKLDKQAKKANFGIDNPILRYTLDLTFRCFYKQSDVINFCDNECNHTRLVEEGFSATQADPILATAVLFPVLRRAIDWLIYNVHPQGAWRKTILSFVKKQTKLGLEARKHIERVKRQNPSAKIDLDNFVLEDGTKFSRNMIDYVVDQFIDGKLTKDEYFNTSCFLIAAANKTAADCLVSTLYFVASNPGVQERLQESIGREGTDSEYLDWVLKESLRLLPPAPIGCTRTVTRDIEIEGGYVVPKDTLVVTCAYVIHRLKEYWGEDADEFKSERWADTSNHHPMQYIPFGAGPRGCPGRDFAMFQMKMLLSTLLTRYQFECGKKEDLNIFDSPCLIFMLPNSPTRLTVTRLNSD